MTDSTRNSATGATTASSSQDSATQDSSARHAMASHPLMNRQRAFALALIVLECVIFGMLGRTVLFPLFVTAFCAFGFASRWRVRMTPKLRFNLIVTLWLGMLAKYFLIAPVPRYRELFDGQQLVYFFAQFLMLLQSGFFFVVTRNNLLSTSFATLGVSVISSLAIVSIRDPMERSALQGLYVAFVVVAMLFWSASRRPVAMPSQRSRGRAVALSIVVAAIASSGCLAAVLLARYESQLDHWMMEILNGESPLTNIDFSETAKLGSVRKTQQTQSSEIALRVTSRTEPGYFRGRAYDTYDDREWYVMPNGNPVQQVQPPPTDLVKGRPNDLLFKTGASDKRPLAEMTVWPTTRVGGVYFAPLETAYVQVEKGFVVRDQHSILRSDSRESLSRYRLFVGSESRRVMPLAARDNTDRAAEEAKLLLDVPPHLRDDVRLIALQEKHVPKTLSTLEKVVAVRRYFSQYQYSLDASPPPNRDPVEWFLTERPAAHCEYFASGTVILLRLAGVRARYVTGYVVDDQNELSGDFVARQKDAHAWAEALSDDGYWHVVESTPSSGLPTQNNDEDDHSELTEYFAALLQSLKSEVLERGLENVIRDGLTSAFGLFGQAVAVLVCIGLAVFGAKRFLAARRNRPRPLYAPHDLEIVLAPFDRVLEKAFRARHPAETIQQFVVALELHSEATSQPHWRDVAAWFRDYQTLRYGQLDEHEFSVRATALQEAARPLIDGIKAMPK